MDACYGGLAVLRSLPAGSMRFLKDMMLRHSRQVLTAGKADETVADRGGPLPDHSIFTGHMIEGMRGKAASGGVLTANGLMQYVYRMVGRDAGSQQTPHYGWLDGDGDFIFLAPETSESLDDEHADKKGEDQLITVPSVQFESEEENMTVVTQVKECLSEERYRIKLFGIVATETRKAISTSGVDRFPVDEKWSIDDFADRLSRYESDTVDLLAVQALLGYWGTEAHRQVLTLPATRICQDLNRATGNSASIALRWYPALLMLYAAGVAAVAARRYDNLGAILHAPVGTPGRTNSEVELVRAVIKALGEFDEAFKTLPGHENQFTARSEYIFKLIQPMLDDLFFLGTTYEAAFDEFEVLLAIDHVVLDKQDHRIARGPVGRFGWKFHRDDDASPLHKVIKAAETQGESWPPLRAGLFGGRLDQVTEGVKKLNGQVANLPWF